MSKENIVVPPRRDALIQNSLNWLLMLKTGHRNVPKTSLGYWH